MKLSVFATRFAVIVAMTSLLVPSAMPVRAQDKMATPPKSGTQKKDAAVYVCKQCKMYMSASMAKKMGYKDPMGHKMTKMAKAPAGFMDGSKMGHKMDTDKPSMPKM